MTASAVALLLSAGSGVAVASETDEGAASNSLDATSSQDVETATGQIDEDADQARSVYDSSADAECASSGGLIGVLGLHGSGCSDSETEPTSTASAPTDGQREVSSAASPSNSSPQRAQPASAARAEPRAVAPPASSSPRPQPAPGQTRTIDLPG